MALSWLEGCWKYWGFEMATEGVMARSHSESWGETVAGFRSCNAKTADAD